MKFNLAQAYVKAGRTADAIPLLDDVARNAGDPALAEAARGWLARLR